MPLVLLTGGCGFIGRHTLQQLLERGYNVRILDIHTEDIESKYSNEVEIIKGDMCNKATTTKALENVDYVINLVAKVGIGQSMYEPYMYSRENALSIGAMWDTIIKNDLDISGIVHGSTMSLYGEGRYLCSQCGEVYPDMRTPGDVKNGWDPPCPLCGGYNVEPIPTPETAPLKPTSVYALGKLYQEQMALLMGKTYGIPVVALRYFNVIGPGQSLTNPYTGVCSIFFSALKTGRRGIIFEDGMQSRDFVYVGDVARANVIAMESKKSGVYNIGTGERSTIKDIAVQISEHFGLEFMNAFKITYRYRKGDVRHIYASTEKAKRDLGFVASVGIKEALREFISWAEANKEYDTHDEIDTLLKYHILE